MHRRSKLSGEKKRAPHRFYHNVLTSCLVFSGGPASCSRARLFSSWSFAVYSGELIGRRQTKKWWRRSMRWWQMWGGADDPTLTMGILLPQRWDVHCALKWKLRCPFCQHFALQRKTMRYCLRQTFCTPDGDPSHVQSFNKDQLDIQDQVNVWHVCLQRHVHKHYQMWQCQVPGKNAQGSNFTKKETLPSHKHKFNKQICFTLLENISTRSSYVGFDTPTPAQRHLQLRVPSNIVFDRDFFLSRQSISNPNLLVVSQWRLNCICFTSFLSKISSSTEDRHRISNLYEFIKLIMISWNVEQLKNDFLWSSWRLPQWIRKVHHIKFSVKKKYIFFLKYINF